MLALAVVACLALALVVLYQARSGASEPHAFPPPGSCHARGHGLFVLPDARCTPGATNPAVTQATIGRTICVPGWSGTVRPPESITEPQKRVALAAYGDYDGRSLGRYEFDHLINISIGGALDSPKNLWPEPDYPNVSADSFYLNPKDRLEDKLHALVCDRRHGAGHRPEDHRDKLGRRVPKVGRSAADKTRARADRLVQGQCVLQLDLRGLRRIRPLQIRPTRR